jgi:hypothetical protein
MKRRKQSDEINDLKGKIAKQAETIKFLLKRIENLKAIIVEIKTHGKVQRD